MISNGNSAFDLRLPVPGELETMPPLVSDKARDSETSSDSCLDQRSFSQSIQHASPASRRRCVVGPMPIVVVLEIEELSLEIAFIPKKCFVETLAPDCTDESSDKGM